jgi:chorismate lyase / 3-hydroxybenzoate synthase
VAATAASRTFPMLDCFLSRTPELAPDTLACISFGAAASSEGDPRRVAVPLAALAGPAHEVWRTSGPVVTGQTDGFDWARGDAVLFGQLAPADDEPYADAIERAYARILAFTAQQGYPRLLRVWNYFGDIHRGEGDAERYRQFCVGRHRVLGRAPGFEQHLPAATVIGSRAPGTLIYFFAGREGGTQVENPRQTPAFRYPREYAPSAPSFSRAVLKRWPGATLLFVSGTASVVGHASRHPHDTPAQLDETLANLRALLDSAGAAGPGWRARGVKVYLRQAGELATVREQLEAANVFAGPVLYLEGDICRTDLKVEVEALYLGGA